MHASVFHARPRVSKPHPALRPAYTGRDWSPSCMLSARRTPACRRHKQQRITMIPTSHDDLSPQCTRYSLSNLRKQSVLKLFPVPYLSSFLPEQPHPWPRLVNMQSRASDIIGPAPSVCWHLLSCAGQVVHSHILFQATPMQLTQPRHVSETRSQLTFKSQPHSSITSITDTAVRGVFFPLKPVKECALLTSKALPCSNLNLIYSLHVIEASRGISKFYLSSRPTSAFVPPS